MHTIMIVDDDPDIRSSIKDIFEKHKMRVMDAADGEECLKEIKIQKPDLILLDIMMPGLPVQMVIPEVSDIPIIFLSALQYTQAEQFGITTQPNIKGFIQKPFDIDTLVKKVKEVLET